MRKILFMVLVLYLTCNIAKADFAQHYNAGQQYLSQYQYSSAISEFKKALRINYMDNSARIGLVNSYLARGTYFANKDRNWQAAANDYRAALFYLKYYPSDQDVQNSMQAISNTLGNLNQCLEMQKFNTSADSRYKTAKDLRMQGLFPEAGYEFHHTLTNTNLRADSYEQIGDIMKVLGNDPKASEYYQKSIALDPSNAGLRLKYARVLDRLGKDETAVTEYNYALANGGNDPEILYALERICRQKLASAPKDSANLTNLGAILQKQNKLDEALQYYMQASQLDPTNVTTRLNVGTLYQQKKSYDSAIAAYDSILFLYPSHKEANLYKAQCLAEMGKNDAALTGYKKVLSVDPSNQQAKDGIFNILKVSKSPEEIMAYLNQNPSLNKNAVDDIYDYAILLHKQGKFDEAIAYYKEILKVKTSNPEVYINLAIAYKQKEDFISAKQILSEAKIKFPANKQILDNLQELAQETVAGKFDEASKAYNLGDYQKALSIYQAIQPPSFDSLSGTAACYKALNNDVQAIEYYKKAFNLNQTSDIAYYIGVLYFEKEDWNSAKTYLQKSLTINSNNQEAKDLMVSVKEQLCAKLVEEGIALYDKADYVNALTMFNKALQEDSKSSYALYYRGLINDINKKYQAAIDDYKKTIQYNPELTIVYYLMALDYDALSQYKSALTYYKRYVQLTTEDNEYKKYSQSRIDALKKYAGS